MGHTKGRVNADMKRSKTRKVRREKPGQTTSIAGRTRSSLFSTFDDDQVYNLPVDLVVRATKVVGRKDLVIPREE